MCKDAKNHASAQNGMSSYRFLKDVILFTCRALGGQEMSVAAGLKITKHIVLDIALGKAAQCTVHTPLRVKLMICLNKNKNKNILKM